MSIKDEIIITPVSVEKNAGQTMLRLNMSVRNLFDALHATGHNFHDVAEKEGIKLNNPILASEQDVSDYLDFDSQLKEYGEFDYIPTEHKYAYEIINELINLVYFDNETIDAGTGKKGLADSNGKVVVPPVFDSCKGCRDMSEVDSLAIVEKDGKFYLTPRDNSGRLVNEIPYDEIKRSCAFGWVKRNGKCGLIDIKTGKDIIPCTMDWIEDVGFYSIVCGKKGYIGLYDTYLNQYVSPRFKEFDFTTRQFCRSRKWGWILRNGKFVGLPPFSDYHVLTIGTNIESVLEPNEKPLNEGEKEYYTEEELYEYLDSLSDSSDEIDDSLECAPEKLLELAPVEVPEGIKADKKLLSLMKKALRRLRDDFDYKALIKIVPTSCEDAPTLNIQIESPSMDLITLSWKPRNRKTAWYDALFKPLAAFHQTIKYSPEGLAIKFYRTFYSSDAETVAGFVSYYYSSVWCINISQCKIETLEWNGFPDVD